MSVFCTISGIVTDPNGVPAAGAQIRIERAIVAGSRNTDYETATTTDSSGAFSFTIPQGSRIRFQSHDVSVLSGTTINVPNNISLNLGNFKADIASELGGRALLGRGSVPAAVEPYITAREIGDVARQVILTLRNLPVTLVKNGTSTGGGGTKIYDFPAGMLLPKGGSSDLTIAAAGDKSFLAGVGSAAADTGGTITSTEISFLPSTAATTTSGAGTCKMKPTSTTPTPGGWLDGTSSAISAYLNSCLNADATGVEALTFSGTIILNFELGGDS